MEQGSLERNLSIRATICHVNINGELDTEARDQGTRGGAQLGLCSIFQSSFVVSWLAGFRVWVGVSD